MKKILYITTILVGVLLVSSCEDFLDVNTDPNNPTEVSPDLILPVGQVYSAEINTGYKYSELRRGTNWLGNMFMYNWSEAYGFSWYDEEFKYLVTTTFYDQLFDDMYNSSLKQYQDLAELDVETYGLYVGMAEIMKAFHFQILVDLYGDIPYTEALQRGSNPTPVYDDAATIYSDLITKLTEAIATLKTADANVASMAPSDDDVMFGGDVTSWIQFANTLKVRILNRMSGVSASFVTDELAVIAAEGSGYISTNVTVNPGYYSELNKQNPFYDGLGWDEGGNIRMNNDATCATDYILSFLGDRNDPRLGLLYEEPEDGHLGVQQGIVQTDDLAADFVSNIGPGLLKGPSQDAVIFTFAEHNFNMAELAQNSFSVGGTAKSFYEAGIRASFEYLNANEDGDEIVSTDEEDLIGTYMNQSIENVDFDYSSNKIEAIITQKWIALNGVDAIQSWFDYSRTGYPSNLPVSVLSESTTSDRPVRLAYPNSEVVANSANLPTQPNVYETKIFWAQ